jgi:hypothetical protein
VSEANVRFWPKADIVLPCYSIPLRTVLSVGATMRRRDFIKIAFGTAAGWPVSVLAQPSGRTLRIGALWRGHWNLRKIEHRREPPGGDMQRRGESGQLIKGQRTTGPKARKAPAAHASANQSAEQCDRLKYERDAGTASGDVRGPAGHQSLGV